MTRPLIRRVQRRQSAPTTDPAATGAPTKRRATVRRQATLDGLRLQLAHGDTCIRIAAQQRGLTPAELKAQLYGGAP